MGDHTTIPIIGEPAREVRATLPDEGALQQATQALLDAGFDRGDLSLPDPAAPVGDAASAGSPVNEQDVRQVRTLATSTLGVAGALAGGALASVATGGALAPVAVAAVASAVGAGGLAHLNTQQSADDREAAHNEKASVGKLMLSAVARDPDKAVLATRLLREAGATQVETIERGGL